MSSHPVPPLNTLEDGYVKVLTRRKMFLESLIDKPGYRRSEASLRFDTKELEALEWALHRITGEGLPVNHPSAF